MTISISSMHIDQFNAVSSVSIDIDEDATADVLVHQAIVPLLQVRGYHISSIKSALLEAAADIAEIEDSIKHKDPE